MRNMVAECLGKLALIDALQVIPALLGHLKVLIQVCFGCHFNPQYVQSDKPVVRSTAVTSLKFAITDNAPVAELKPHIEAFLDLMMDADLSSRRAALLTFNSVRPDPFTRPRF